MVYLMNFEEGAFCFFTEMLASLDVKIVLIMKENAPLTCLLQEIKAIGKFVKMSNYSFKNIHLNTIKLGLSLKTKDAFQLSIFLKGNSRVLLALCLHFT